MKGENIALIVIFVVVIIAAIGALVWYLIDRANRTPPQTPAPTQTPTPTNTPAPTQSASGAFFTISSLNGNYLSSNLPYAPIIKDGFVNEYYLGSLSVTGTVSKFALGAIIGKDAGVISSQNTLIFNLSGSVTGTNIPATYTGTDQSLTIQFGSGEKWYKVPTTIKALDGNYTSGTTAIYSITNGIGSMSQTGAAPAGFTVQPNTDFDSVTKPFVFVFSPTNIVKAFTTTPNGVKTITFDTGSVWTLIS